MKIIVFVFFVAIGPVFAQTNQSPVTFTNKFEATKAKAESGDAQAQYELGNCYYRGEGAAKNAAEAAKWYRRAAEQGNAAGENGLGSCCSNGEGVPLDKPEAMKWFHWRPTDEETRA